MAGSFRTLSILIIELHETQATNCYKSVGL